MRRLAAGVRDYMASLAAWSTCNFALPSYLDAPISKKRRGTASLKPASLTVSSARSPSRMDSSTAPRAGSQFSGNGPETQMTPVVSPNCQSLRVIGGGPAARAVRVPRQRPRTFTCLPTQRLEFRSVLTPSGASRFPPGGKGTFAEGNLGRSAGRRAFGTLSAAGDEGGDTSAGFGFSVSRGGVWHPSKRAKRQAEPARVMALSPEGSQVRATDVAEGAPCASPRWLVLGARFSGSARARARSPTEPGKPE
jgi:hypothetical protein